MVSLFVSWSGDRSRRIAEAISDWVVAVLPTCPRPWVSTRLDKGVRWSVLVGQRLSDADFGIVCVTPENLTSPWLLFESGALSKAVGDVRVCPLLFGLSAEELDGPLSQFQAALFDEADLLLLASTINSLLGPDALATAEIERAHAQHWPALHEQLQAIEQEPIAPAAGAFDGVLQALSRHGLPEPLGSQVTFTSGFESHGLYSSVMEAASSRLWIFGRKNRKVFDKEHSDFYRDLKARVDDGFDFRVLFLDPLAPAHILQSAHRDADFSSQLARCVASAKEVLEAAGLDPAQHCRTYAVHRTVGVVVCDEAALLSPIHLDEHGNVKGLTKASFSVAPASSDIGAEWVQAFESLWSVAAPLAPST